MDLEVPFSDETDDIVCEICGGRSDVGIRPIMFKGFSCHYCLYVWYDGAGVTPEKVRAESLAMQKRVHSASVTEERK